MKERVNNEVKRRESFRPFAPVILQEHAHRYLAIRPNRAWQPYYASMLLAVQALPSAQKEIPAVIHVDNSVRPQVVTRNSNERLHRLLTAFYQITGTPALLNTSFNVRGEPVVCSPDEAIKCFYSTGLDMLVLGNWVLEK